MVDAEIIQMNRLRKARAIAQCWRQLGYGANDLQQMVERQSGMITAAKAVHDPPLSGVGRRESRIEILLAGEVSVSCDPVS
jgi:hypothetical protein